jgi:hypothetical protein
LEEASAVFGTIAANQGYPRIHQMEGAESKAECDRLAQGNTDYGSIQEQPMMNLATNWMYDSVVVGSIDPEAKTITTAWCYNRLSGWPDIKSGNPYAVFNLLEEIDQPGEWYLDRAKGVLYLYPSAICSKAIIDLSRLPGPMLTVTNASHVRHRGTGS